MRHLAQFILKKSFALLFAVLAMACIVCQLQAQVSKTLSFYAIDNTNGLPHNYINEIARDSLGFLWIATNDGLCRFDSPQNLKSYKKGELGLQSSNIRSLYVDHNNTLWIGTRFGGLTRFNSNLDTTKTYSTIGAEGMVLTNDEILSMCETDNNEMWVGTENGLNVIDLETDSIFQFPVNPNDEFSLQAKAILDIWKDDKSRIWIGTWDGGMYLYLPAKSNIPSEGKFRRFDISNHIGSRNVWEFHQDSKGRIWIATHSGGLYLMQLPVDATDNVDQQEWQPIFHPFLNDPISATSISSDYIQGIQEDANGNIWIGSVHGLNIIESHSLENISGSDYSNDPIKLPFKRQFYNPSQKGSLNNNNLTEIFRDQQGLMWIGSISGINQYNWYTNQFDLFNIRNNVQLDDNKFELINNIFIRNDSTAILASDINGILHYDMNNHTIIEKPPYSVKELHKRVTYIHPGKNDLLYIGTIKGLAILNQVNNTSKLFPLPSVLKSEDPNIYISCIYKDSKGRLWGGTERQLFLLDEKTGEYTFFTHEHDNPNSIPDNSITHIYEDSQSNIWISTFNGLCKVTEGDTISFQSFKRNQKGIGLNIPSNQITCISEYDGKVYFGSHNGIFHYNLADSSFSILETSQKVYSLQSLEITNSGILWAGTSDGILRYNLLSNDKRLYSKNDGIGDMSFRINSSYMHQKEDLFFGGIKGFLRIRSQELKRNTIPPKVYITDIETINYETSSKFNITTLDRISLEPNNFYLSINYAALNYNQSEYNQYAYRLEGFKDDEWKNVGTKQQAIYTNLDHGEYTFKVKASNNEGIWNEEETELHIRIKPSLSETLWFRIIAIISLLLITYFLFRRYTRNIKIRNQFLSNYNDKLNHQIEITKAAQQGLIEREKSMKELLTKLDESNQELTRSNKDLEQFAYVASHDMKEPLRTIGTFTNLFQRKYKEAIDSPGTEYLNFITEGVDRMSALINSLLTYSQVGKKDIQFEYANIADVVQSKVKDLSKLKNDRNVSISIGDLPMIYCAPDQIGMVFYNLILNGIKFNKKSKPQITIDCEESKEEWTFSVKDNGIGIAKEYQSQIFEIFKRLHSREEYEGTGIGLALCNKIINRHGGIIWLKSEIGLGTTFYFTIKKKLQPNSINFGEQKSETLEKEVQKILRA